MEMTPTLENQIMTTFDFNDIHQIVNDTFSDCIDDYFREVYDQLDVLNKKIDVNPRVINAIRQLTYNLELLASDYIIEDMYPNFNYVPQYNYCVHNLEETEYSDVQDFIADLIDLQNKGYIKDLKIIDDTYSNFIFDMTILNVISVPIEVFNTKMGSLHSTLSYFKNW